MQNLYHVLGVVSTASQEEIRTTYIQLTKKYHPDFNPGNSYSEERMKDINRAYDILGDEVLRYRYDEQLAYGFIEPKPQPYYETYPGYSQNAEKASRAAEANRRFEKRATIFARVILSIILLLTLAGIIWAIYLNNIEEDGKDNSYTILQFAGINPENNDTVWRNMTFYGNYSDDQLKKLMGEKFQEDKQNYYWPADMMSLADQKKWLINNLSGSLKLNDVIINNNTYQFSDLRIAFTGDTLNITYLINEKKEDSIHIPMHAFQSFGKNGNEYCIYLSYNTIYKYDVSKGLKQWSDRFCFNAITKNMPGYERKMNEVLRAISRSK